MHANETTSTVPAMKTELDTIESAIEAIRNGEVIIVMDDEDRENEGDFLTAIKCHLRSSTSWPPTAAA